jgi:hypothetical protein
VVVVVIVLSFGLFKIYIKNCAHNMGLNSTVIANDELEECGKILFRGLFKILFLHVKHEEADAG